MLDHEVPDMFFGWGVPGEEVEDKIKVEELYFDQVVAQNPISYQARPAKEMDPVMLKKWNDFQASKGLEPESVDMTLLTEFVFGKKMWWLPQDTGSCVWSNTFRAVVARMLFEIMLKGDPEEWFGDNEFGVKSIAPHMISYGFARQRANMRGGDGLYCQPMIDSMMKDGFVTCNTPKLKELMDKAGATREDDYPEPRSTSLIRRLQNWEFNDALKPYGDFKLQESSRISSGEDLWEALGAFKPAIQCSGIAIKLAGKDNDGFPIHTRDRSTSLAHNMSWQGRRVSKTGKRYVRLSNESWVQKNASDETANKYIYTIPLEEADTWVRSSSVDCMTIGELDLPDSMPVFQ